MKWGARVWAGLLGLQRSVVGLARPVGVTVGIDSARAGVDQCRLVLGEDVLQHAQHDFVVDVRRRGRAIV
ncbi:MAG: hypothetical protein WKF96_25105, partial [Solirubrobacteraceae bacterium]